MGVQGSKQIQRKLPQHVVSEVKSSALESHSHSQVSEPNSTSQLASTTRNKVIEKDGKDPQLLENLFKIGEVKLSRDNIKLIESDEMMKIVRGREAEKILNEGNTIPKNRVTVQTLREILNQRIIAPGEWTFEKISTHYNLDQETIKTFIVA
ncbi:8959_t:CDS:2 [Diversispora eburnea]|uniref:8959_t:CDS:1 n=1 Tax=Diversispora eburnea TaxID=1213867 RepID=A0A9N8WHW9_9GLOM|nr:8959_t:CDS:2 [Diversispora eburnea]